MNQRESDLSAHKYVHVVMFRVTCEASLSFCHHRTNLFLDGADGNHVQAGLWRCLCSSCCVETQAADFTAGNSSFLTVGILQVFAGVCQGRSRASWHEGWEPSAEFNDVLYSCSDSLPLKKKEKRRSTNNLGVVSRHTSSAKQSQAGGAVGGKGASPQPVWACTPYRGVAASCHVEPQHPAQHARPSPT